MSVFLLSFEEIHLQLMEGGSLWRDVELARISVNLSCLHEPVFTPKGNNEGGKRNPADECVWLHFQNSVRCIIICPSFMHL